MIDGRQRSRTVDTEVTRLELLAARESMADVDRTLLGRENDAALHYVFNRS